MLYIKSAFFLYCILISFVTVILGAISNIADVQTRIILDKILRFFLIMGGSFSFFLMTLVLGKRKEWEINALFVQRLLIPQFILFSFVFFFI